MRSKTHLTVTMCLYRIPKNSARSLSTLTAHDVNTDTVHKSNNGDSEEWLWYKTNKDVRDCQTAQQKFGRGMKRQNFSKSFQDQIVANNCRDGEQNICSGKNYS
ncbi:hypothetical protein pdam_00001277 [Pocillopora damicornis]|uniref:Uncharacterized protein n=1 Tax=Pocillopora damicornis TaxID=46731 RepID=A0A3M6TL64_POCDA|nr:hypothetical protein pdam_00001277 [Pocillopora damicornis]